MALALFDRVQETTTTSGTGAVTLAGAVPGFQSFAVVGNGNTCYYTILDGTAWEVGIGTYSTTGPSLARTTVLSNSNANTSPITLSGSTSTVFLTYPAEKSVNLDASGNVSPLGTVSSGVWQGTTVGVAYGGTGVTASSGANSVVLRDANSNVTANNFLNGYTAITAAGTTTVLTAASSYYQRIGGSTTQTIQLPDATTCVLGQSWVFDNDSSGTVTIVDSASATVDTVPSGGYSYIFAESISTSAGSWGKYALLPASYDFSTTSANFGAATISNAVYNGTAIGTAYGGTGLSGASPFTSGGALYANSASTLTSGTLPATAGGTGQTSAFTQYGVTYGASTTALATTLAGTSTQVLHGNAAGAPTWGAVSLTADITGILGAANGGTGNGFFAVSGPATATKTFTFPNASATVLTDNALVTVAQGGTNSSATPTAGGVGYGTGTAHAYTLVGTSGQPLISAGAGAPAFGTLALGTANVNVSGTLTPTNGGTGVGTLTGVAYGNGTSAFTAATGAQIATALGTSLTSLGTVTVGTWQAVGIGTAYGGTGLTGSSPFNSGGVMYASSTSALTTSSTVSISSGNLTITQGSSYYKGFSDNVEEYLIRGTTASNWQGYITYTPSAGTANRGFKFGAWNGLGARVDWLTIWNGDLTSLGTITGTTVYGSVAVRAGGSTVSPGWGSVFGETGIGASSGNKFLYFYNNGTTIKVDAYDYGTSSALGFQLGGNGGAVTVANVLNVYGNSGPTAGRLNLAAGGAGGVGWSTGLNIGDSTNYTGFIQDGGVSRWRNFGTGGYDWYSSGGSQLMALNNSGVLTLTASGTVINIAGQSDSIGYNSTSGYGTYIKGTGGTYIYGGGLYWDGSAARTIWNSGLSSVTTAGNATWGGRVQLGGNGGGSGSATIATMQATNGNLHLDPGSGNSLYLNYYQGSTIYFGNGAGSATVGYVTTGGSAVLNGSVWAQGQNNTFGTSAGQTTVATIYSQSNTADSTTYPWIGYNSAGTGTSYVRSDGVFSTGAAANSPYNLTTANAANVVVQGAATGVLYRSTSSARYKHNIQDAWYGLKELMRLRPVTYQGLNDGDKVFGGLTAEDVDAAGLKEFVNYDEHGRPDSLAYANMVSLLTKAIQDLKTEFDAYKAANPAQNQAAVETVAAPWSAA